MGYSRNINKHTHNIATLKLKILTFFVVASSLFGYLEWGRGNHSFLYEVEYEVLKKIFSNPISAIHPLTLIPLTGQIILITTLIFSRFNRYWIYLGIACLGLLLGFMTLIGLLGLNLKIWISTIPFLIFSIYTIREIQIQKKTEAISSGYYYVKYLT